MITRILTDTQRERLLKSLSEWDMSEMKTLLEEIQTIERRLTEYKQRFEVAERLIESEDYKAAQTIINQIVREIHNFEPLDPLYSRAPFGHQIHLEAVGLSARIDMITFLADSGE